MPVVYVPTDEITGWRTFHDAFARTLGFPDFYGGRVVAAMESARSGRERASTAGDPRVDGGIVGSVVSDIVGQPQRHLAVTATAET